MDGMHARRMACSSAEWSVHTTEIMRGVCLGRWNASCAACGVSDAACVWLLRVVRVACCGVLWRGVVCVRVMSEPCSAHVACIDVCTYRSHLRMSAWVWPVRV